MTHSLPQKTTPALSGLGLVANFKAQGFALGFVPQPLRGSDTRVKCTRVRLRKVDERSPSTFLALKGRDVRAQGAALGERSNTE